MRKTWRWLATMVLILIVSLSVISGVGAAPADEPADVREVTLDDIVGRAIGLDANLKLLEYTIRMLSYRQMTYDDEVKTLAGSAVYTLLPVEPAELAEMMPDDGSLEPEEWIRLILTQAQINASLNGLIRSMGEQSARQAAEQRQQLLAAIDETHIQQDRTELQRQEATEAARLYLAQLFYQIVGLEEQRSFYEKQIVYLNAELERAERMKTKGLIDQSAYDEAAAAVRESKLKQTTVEAQFESSFRLLCFQLNWSPDEIRLADVSTEGKMVQAALPTDYASLIESSYVFREADQDVKAAEYAERAAAGDGFNTRMQKGAERDIAAQKKEVLYESLYEQIGSICLNVQEVYAKGLQANEQLSAAKQAEGIAERKFKAGIISRAEADKAVAQRRYARLQSVLTAYEYAVALERLDAVKRG